MGANESRGARRRADRERGGSDLKAFYIVLAVVAVVGIGIVGYNIGSGAMGAAVAEPVEVEGLDDPGRLVQLAQGIVEGDPDAPITIMEFADYQCPGCRYFGLNELPALKEELVETGQARFVFYDFPLTNIHPNAFLAARAARCAGDQERYWDYHDALFREQAEWSGESNPAELFVDYAGALGMDEDAFEACLRSDRHAGVVSANRRLALELRIPGTPALLVRGSRGMPLRLEAQRGMVSPVRAAIDTLRARGLVDGAPADTGASDAAGADTSGS